MPKSKIIKELSTGTISVERALNSLFLLASDVQDEDLMKWTECELQGYKDANKVPDYRRTNGYAVKYSGIVGNLQFTNSSLPPHYLSKETFDSVSEITISDSISSIMRHISEGASLSFDRGYLIPEVLQRTGGRVQCTSITQSISLSFFDDIVAAVKQRTIKQLIELEHKYGCLDSLEIQDDNDPENVAFWNNINQRIKVQSKELYSQAFYDSAAEKAVREVETKLRELFRILKPGEHEPVKVGDIIGALLTSGGAFHYCDVTTPDGKNYCEGFVRLVQGFFLAYRNPMAHSNRLMTKQESFELIALSSLIMEVLESKESNPEK